MYQSNKALQKYKLTMILHNQIVKDLRLVNQRVTPRHKYNCRFTRTSATRLISILPDIHRQVNTYLPKIVAKNTTPATATPIKAPTATSSGV